jgi:hypothetical protein
MLRTGAKIKIADAYRQFMGDTPPPTVLLSHESGLLYLTRWPLKIAAGDLFSAHAFQLAPRPSQAAPGRVLFEHGPIPASELKRLHQHADECALKHNTFFGQLGGDVPVAIAFGVTSNGHPVEIPAAQWDRTDRYVDLETGDVWDQQRFGCLLWSGVTLQARDARVGRALPSSPAVLPPNPRGRANVGGDMLENSFISRTEAFERVSDARLAELSDPIRPPTQADIELLEEYGEGPTYQPGTRFLGGDGYDPFAEISAGDNHRALLQAQQRCRDWKWHSERVEDWLAAYRFVGKKFERAAFEKAFAACFSSGTELEHDRTIASDYEQQKPLGRLKEENEQLRAVSADAESIQFSATDVAGRMLGDAFLRCAIKDSKVQAFGERICSDYPIFRSLFASGLFPKLSLNSTFGPLAVDAGKWPVVLSASDLLHSFERAARQATSRNLWSNGGKAAASNAAQAIADRHKAFFDLLSGSEVIIDGLSEATGESVIIPHAHWKRTDRYLDVEQSDLLSGVSRRMFGSLKAKFGPAAIERRTDIGNAYTTQLLGPPLGPVMHPADAPGGSMPLFELVYWIATKGGSIGFEPRTREIWDAAWKTVIRAWRLKTLTVAGRPATGEFPENIAAEQIDGVRVVHPFGVDPVGNPMSGTGPYIQSWGRTDDDGWENKGFNDQLYMPGKMLGYTHLKAPTSEVLRWWSFRSARNAVALTSVGVDGEARAPIGPPTGDLGEQQLEDAIRRALKIVEGQIGDKKITGKVHVLKAMKILRSWNVTRTRGSLKEVVEKIADTEFKRCRNPPYVRVAKR